MNAIINDVDVDEEIDFEKAKKEEKDDQIVLTCFREKVGESLGDINLFYKGSINSITEQLKEDPIYNRLVGIKVSLPVQSALGFEKEEAEVKNFESLVEVMVALGKQNLRQLPFRVTSEQAKQKLFLFSQAKSPEKTVLQLYRSLVGGDLPSVYNEQANAFSP